MSLKNWLDENFNVIHTQMFASNYVAELEKWNEINGIALGDKVELLTHDIICVNGNEYLGNEIFGVLYMIDGDDYHITLLDNTKIKVKEEDFKICKEILPSYDMVYGCKHKKLEEIVLNNASKIMKYGFRIFTHELYGVFLGIEYEDVNLANSWAKLRDIYERELRKVA